jgi:hypothetical protein
VKNLATRASLFTVNTVVVSEAEDWDWPIRREGRCDRDVNWPSHET